MILYPPCGMRRLYMSSATEPRPDQRHGARGVQTIACSFFPDACLIRRDLHVTSGEAGKRGKHRGKGLFVGVIPRITRSLPNHQDAPSTKTRRDPILQREVACSLGTCLKRASTSRPVDYALRPWRWRFSSSGIRRRIENLVTP